MSIKKIGVFDSGIGGATVLKEIMKILPYENYIYYSDSKNNPYGDKSDEEVFKICDDIVKKMLNECKMIVIACNTASAKASALLRKKYKNIPIMAIEPAYKLVYDYACDKSTLIMATKGTLDSEKFNKLYTKYDNHRTFLLPCIGLADIIEDGNKKELQSYLKENLSQYAGKFENVVLGCTHYSFIKKEIEDVLGRVEFFEGNKGLANNVKNTLIEKNLLCNKKSKGNLIFFDSSNSQFKKERFYEYLSLNETNR